MIQADVSIIILTKNGVGNLPKLLQRVYSQQYAGNFEVIVIDSGSTDGTLQAAGDHPLKLIQIREDEFHHGRTRNLGAQEAEGRYLVFITQDALPLDNHWLQKLIQNFADPQVEMVAGRQIPWENTRPPEKFFYSYNFPDFKIIVRKNVPVYYRDNVFISNVNAAISRDAWQKYRFSEHLVMAEDKEIAARILAGGGTVIYEPGAAVYHAHDMTFKEAFSRYLDYGLAMRQGSFTLPVASGRRLSRACRYIIDEMSYLKANNCLNWAAYSIIYELCKYAGLLIGHAALLRGPMAVKRESHR
jgi:rhamnosyltransferase